MILIFTIIIVSLTFYWLKTTYRYWEKRGVPGPKPVLFVGNIGENILGRKTVGEVFEDIYNKYKDLPFVGIYRFGTPCLLLRDPEVIKSVIVKDFKSFLDNDNYVDKEVDPIIGRNPFVLKGEEWKTTRQSLTSSFTVQKMKGVFPLLANSCNRMVKYLAELPQTQQIDIKDICTKFTCNNVGACAFGIEVRSFDEPNPEFLQLSRRFLEPESWRGVLLAISVMIPSLMKIFKLKVVPMDVDERLVEIVKSSIKHREENNITRNDFLDSIKKISENDIEITAHAATFFIDGIETSANVMSFFLFDLAFHKECQDILRDEINEVLENYNGEFTYEAIQEMKYLDRCLDESLRLHPQLTYLAKLCTNRHNLTTGSEEYKNLSISIEPGTSIIVPVVGLHMDPKYFPSPEKYDPDRFLNKDNINKYIYLPFGEGPRICIGRRFGVLQVKMGIAYLIKNYIISVNEKTQLPLTYMPFYFVLYPKGGLWLNFEKI